MKSRIMYIENKAQLAGGEAHIGRVTFSKTGRTIYYRGYRYRRVEGYKYNHIEVESGEHYWISGCRKDGWDRLYGERVAILIDEDARVEYWSEVRGKPQHKHIAQRYK